MYISFGTLGDNFSNAVPPSPSGRIVRTSEGREITPLIVAISFSLQRRPGGSAGGVLGTIKLTIDVPLLVDLNVTPGKPTQGALFIFSGK